MIRPILRVAAITAISVMLVIGSFVVGNFGLSEGLSKFGFVWWPSGTISHPSLLDAPQSTNTPINHSFADLVIWLGVAVALFCLWDSLKEGIVAESELVIKPGHEQSRFFKKLKRPPASLQPKRHAKYRDAMAARV